MTKKNKKDNLKSKYNKYDIMLFGFFIFVHVSMVVFLILYFYTPVFKEYAINYSWGW